MDFSQGLPVMQALDTLDRFLACVFVISSFVFSFRMVCLVCLYFFQGQPVMQTRGGRRLVSGDCHLVHLSSCAGVFSPRLMGIICVCVFGVSVFLCLGVCVFLCCVFVFLCFVYFCVCLCTFVRSSLWCKRLRPTDLSGEQNQTESLFKINLPKNRTSFPKSNIGRRLLLKQLFLLFVVGIYGSILSSPHLKISLAEKRDLVRRLAKQAVRYNYLR